MSDTRQPDRELAIERVAGAWRPLDRDGAVAGHPAWFDLDGRAREEAWRVAAGLRQLEAALDDRGLSSTSHAVLRRINDRTR
jgi:hypothetical protein